MIVFTGLDQYQMGYGNTIGRKRRRELLDSEKKIWRKKRIFGYLGL